MEITWQIWQKVLFGVCLTVSLIILCVLITYCIRKCKRFKQNQKDLDEVVVIVDKNKFKDRDPTSNLDCNKYHENSGLPTNLKSSISLYDQKTNKSFLTTSFDSGIDRSSLKHNQRSEWYHSCPEYGRSTITRSENGYILIGQSRPIVIDGNNVSYAYGKGAFSPKGIQIVYNYFRSRGWTNKEIIIFVKPPPNISNEDRNICKEFDTMGVLEWTSRTSRPVSVTSQEDYKILECAKKKGGIIVTKNSFHDWNDCCPEFREVIAKRLLKYSFVNDDIVLLTNKIHRDGKTLEEFLTF